MRPFSLAVKVGFKVGLMSAALLLLFATFAYLMVSQALERNARTDLEVKMVGMAHNLSAITAISGVNADAHQLVDLVMGHNNLYVSIFESTQTLTPLLSIGSKQSTWKCTNSSLPNRRSSESGATRRAAR